MSKRDWSLFVVAGVVGLAGVATWLISQSIQPKLMDYPERPPVTIDSCGYEEARRKTGEARQARDEQPPTATKETIAASASKVEAAERKEADTKECEERARAAADLEAQWAAAIAGQNNVEVASSFFRWASWELFVVALALGAAGWSAYETRKANRIARETGEAQLRPFPMIATGSSMSLVFKPKEYNIDCTFTFPIINGGTTPLFNVRCRFDVYVWQGAMAYPQHGNRVAAFEERFAHLVAGDTAATVSWGDKWGIAKDKWQKAVDYLSHDAAIMDASLAVHCAIEADDYAGRPVQSYAVWMQMLGDDIPEYLFGGSLSEVTIVNRGFSPPRHDFAISDLLRDPAGERYPQRRTQDFTEDKGWPPWWRRLFKRKKAEKAKPRR